jgi:hypothetical protein
MSRQAGKVLIVAASLVAGFVVDANRTFAASYAELRVATAFQVATELPLALLEEFPLVDKGDLVPIGCAGPFRPEVAAECIDSAYELPSEPRDVVETRTGAASSELMRLDASLMAGQ